MPKKFKLEYRNDLVCIGWIYTNVDDMTNYMMMFLNDGTYKGKEILSSDSIKEMKKPYINVNNTDTFGLSLFKSGDLYLHGGDHTNYHALMVWNPTNKNAAIIMYNMNHYFINNDVINIYNAIFKKNLPNPSQCLDSLTIDLVRGSSHTIKNTFNIEKFYIWLNLIFVLILLLIIMSFVKLIKPREKVSDKKIIRILAMVKLFLINIIIPVFVLTVTIVTNNKLILIYNTYPDLTIMLYTISILLLIIGIIKVLQLIKEEKIFSKKGPSVKVIQK